MEGEQLAAWLRARAGKLTASRMAVAMDFLKNGSPSKARSDYQRELVAERLTGDSVRHYVNDAMNWGLEQEPVARSAWEAQSGIIVTDAGFYDHPRIDMMGATPDGLIGSDGLIEIKCPTTTTFVGWVMDGVVPEQHKAQMIAQLACTGRTWCEFVAFDPRIRQADRQLFVRRFTPTADEIAAIEGAAEKFLAEVDALFDAFTQAAT